MKQTARYDDLMSVYETVRQRFGNITRDDWQKFCMAATDFLIGGTKGDPGCSGCAEKGKPCDQHDGRYILNEVLSIVLGSSKPNAPCPDCERVKGLCPKHQSLEVITEVAEISRQVKVNDDTDPKTKYEIAAYRIASVLDRLDHTSYLARSLRAKGREFAQQAGLDKAIFAYGLEGTKGE